MWFLNRKTAPSNVPVWTIAGLVFAVKSAFILFIPMRALASITWLIDDTFIEMRVARNIAMGHGFSLDAVHQTTGAPFLWMYLTSLNHFLPGKDAAIRATLIESTLFGALATVVVFYLALKLTQSRPVAWTAMLLSTFTATAFTNAMNGMETSFYTLVVLLSIATFFNIGRPAKWSSFQWGCVIGLFAGITTMTRGDGIFLLVALVFLRLYQWWVSSKHERKELAKSLAGILLIAGACFAFFMTWQLVQTGSPLPGNQVGRRELSLDLHGFSYDNFSLPVYLKIVAWNVFQLDELLSITVGSSLLALVAFVSGSLQKKLRALGVITAVYLGIFYVLLVAYQWYFPDFHGLRYLNTSAHIFFIFIAFLLWQLPLEAWKKTAVVSLAVCIAVLASYRHYQLSSRMHWGTNLSYYGYPGEEKSKIFWATIDWMNENLPEGTLVGVRDYGRVSMFTKVLVQDLAGNIDPGAAQALNNGTLEEYLKSRKVEHLLIPTLEERSDKLYQYIYKEMKLQPVKDAPHSPGQNLYKIIW